MVRGLYTAYTGMSNEQKRLDIIANNLANAATVGYKEDSVTNQSFDNVLTYKIKDSSEASLAKPIGRMSLGVKLGEVYTNYKQGSLRQSDGKYHLALEGKGFFALSVQDSSGNESVRYTRNGAFTITKDGLIVDENGNAVLGESGEVIIPLESREVTIDKSGNIYADNILINKLSIVDFEDYNYLKKSQDTMYEAVDGAEEIDSNASVHQGFTEQSNVNSVSEMVQMITVTRAYEANQKIIQSIDKTLELAANSVGKV